MSQLTFTPIGGGSEIGANCYLLGAEGRFLAIDCGLHPKKEGGDALPEFALMQRAPDAVVVSHAHIDHCGAVPFLLRMLPEIECFTTIPTARIMDRMLHNSVAVMKTLASEQGISGYPLYTHKDVDNAMRRTYGVEYGRQFAPTWDSPFEVAFQHAGHVLGSASVLIHVPGHTFFYTGDICIGNQELMRGLEPLDPGIEVDTLIMESTRGAHLDVEGTSFTGEIRRFAEEVSKVLDGGGVALVPTFALGRTQELLNVIARLQQKGRLPDVPVYASGLGRAIYEVYSRFTEYMRPGAEPRPLEEFDRIGDVWEPSVRRNLLKDPAIIVATSGMMVQNTPSAMLAMDIVRENRHGIFFVGYLDPDTPGYKLLHAEKGGKVALSTSAQPVEIVLENRQSFRLSAHAARDELLELIEEIKPKNVVFIHGDREAVEWMAENAGGQYVKYTPTLGETIVLES